MSVLLSILNINSIMILMRQLKTDVGNKALINVDLSEMPQTALSTSVKPSQCILICCVNYHRRGKIHWTKYSRFQHHQSFHRNTFPLPWPYMFIISTIKERCLYSWKNFHGTCEKCESLVQQIFPHLQYISYCDFVNYPIS